LTRKIGRYEIVGDIATGGMAEILLARLSGPSGFERAVVIKRIRQDLDREELARYFLDEARVVARLRHANVVYVEDLGTDEDGAPYIVMEYVEGESVASLARRLVSRGERMSQGCAAFIVAQACAGLHAAHELRDAQDKPLALVHRDVSPQNILVGFDGAVKVSDFGIAKTANSEKTDVGRLRGKWGYMAPEQLTRAPVDRRTDVFALGIVLYELATGHRLFKRFSPAAIANAVTKEPILPPTRVSPNVPDVISAICMRALSRPPEERYATAADMRRDLVAALRTIGADEPETDLSETMKRCLEDRIADKQEVVRNVREGSVVSNMPDPDVDVHTEIPCVDENSDPLTEGAGAPPASLPTPMLTPTPTPALKRTSPLVWIVPAALVLAGGAALGVRRLSASEIPSANATTNAAAASTTTASAESVSTPVVTTTASAAVAAPTDSDPPAHSGPGKPRRTVVKPPPGPTAAPPPPPPAETAAPPAPSGSTRGFRRFQ
jgi:serine/threonine-protein kinase